MKNGGSNAGNGTQRCHIIKITKRRLCTGILYGGLPVWVAD
jgi:hypothetical protein